MKRPFHAGSVRTRKGPFNWFRKEGGSLIGFLLLFLCCSPVVAGSGAESRFNLVLIQQDPTTKARHLAFIRDTEKDKVEPFALGQKLFATDWRLVAFLEEKVLIQSASGANIQLTMPMAVKPNPVKPTVGVIAAEVVQPKPPKLAGVIVAEDYGVQLRKYLSDAGVVHLGISEADAGKLEGAQLKILSELELNPVSVAGSDAVGLAIAFRAKASLGERCGLKTGDILMKVEGVPVSGVNNLMELLDKLKNSKRRVQADLLRGGKPFTVIVEAFNR